MSSAGTASTTASRCRRCWPGLSRYSSFLAVFLLAVIAIVPSATTAELHRLLRRAITADNPTGVYIAYSLGWHNPATGNFGGNITLGELAPASTPVPYSIKLFFNNPSTLVQDYWGDYRITHYQSGAYHIQPGSIASPQNNTRTYQFNGVYPIGANSTVQDAFLSAASLLHGPNYTDRETGFQRDDVRVAPADDSLPTTPFGPFVRASGSKNAPTSNGAPAGSAGEASGAAADSSSGIAGNVPMIAGVAAAAVALIALLIVGLVIMRRRSAKNTGLEKKPPTGGWSTVESPSGGAISSSSPTVISPPSPAPGSMGLGKYGNGPSTPGSDISGPLAVGAIAGTALGHRMGNKSAPSAATKHYQQTQYSNDVSNYVMGNQDAAPGAGSMDPQTHEQYQLDFVEQYSSANYQPNPYRDTIQTTAGVGAYGYRDTMAAPPVPALPGQHPMNDDVDIADMVERYGHDSMYPQQTSEPYNYENYPAIPEIPKGYHARDTFFTPSQGNVQFGSSPPSAPQGGSYNASSALKQRLDQEEAKLTAQQRHLAELEHAGMQHSASDGSAFPANYGNDRYVDDTQREGKTAGVVRSRSTVSRAPKSPMRTDAPPEWLGGSSVTQGSDLSRSIPGPGYI